VKMNPAHIPVRQLLEDKINKEGEMWPFRLVEFRGNETVEAVLRKMSGHKILAAPVKLSNDKYFLLDMETMLARINESMDPTTVRSILLEHFCSDFSEMNVMKIDESVLAAVNILAIRGPRVLVLEDESPVGIVTHTDIIKFVKKRWDLIPKQVLEIPVSHLMTRHPYFISLEDKVGEAIKKFTLYSWSGSAVVDHDGVIVANLSISDLRGVLPEHLNPLLCMTVKKFLSETKKDLLKVPITCTSDTTFYTIIKTMFQNHIHRIHVVDSEMRPIGVCSTTDVLAELSRIIQ